MNSDILRAFRQRLRARERLIGTFLKTPTAHATEILGEVGFDFVVVDAEHAPFSRSDIDLLMLGAQAANIASLVRVQSAHHWEILNALDCGAAGVLVPHVTSAEVLRDIIAAARYRGGSRGFSNSARAGGYGTLGIQEHVATGDESTSILAMIEDPIALDRLDEIFAVEGLTGAFIGRGDLSVAFGAATPTNARVQDAVRRISDAAARHDVPLLAHVGASASVEAGWLAEMGVTGFIVASDQGLMRQAALANRRDFGAS
jgi:2-keto-3-deoxy-L-rhamnonate aldolase RhmA